MNIEKVKDLIIQARKLYDKGSMNTNFEAWQARHDAQKCLDDALKELEE